MSHVMKILNTKYSICTCDYVPDMGQRLVLGYLPQRDVVIIINKCEDVPKFLADMIGDYMDLTNESKKVFMEELKKHDDTDLMGIMRVINQIIRVRRKRNVISQQKTLNIV